VFSYPDPAIVMVFPCVLSVPGIGLTPTEKPDKDHISRAVTLAKKSTASVGRFTEQLPKEKPAKNMGRKRKVCHSCIMVCPNLR